MTALQDWEKGGGYDFPGDSRTVRAKTPAPKSGRA